MVTDEQIKYACRQVQVPDYVSPNHIKRIIQTIREGRMHPDKPGCDMTAEIAAGVPVMVALEHHSRRPLNSGSIYARLYEHLN